MERKRRERGGVGIKEENGGTQCGGLADHWRELDFDSERDGKLLGGFKQRKDVILHRTRKDASSNFSKGGSRETGEEDVPSSILETPGDWGEPRKQSRRGGQILKML